MPSAPESTLFTIGDTSIPLGQTVDLTLQISESYSGAPIHLPVRISRGTEPGRALFVVAAIHGDELNGTGIVRELIADPPPLKRGTLVLVPVVNMLGFERHSRYMPDRRDLNRHFPGSPEGSLTSRLAHAIFQNIVRPCDFGIDLHSAANFRVNIPNVRADMSVPAAARIARAFGCELIINNTGPRASLRRAANAAGCATILLEAGEPWKIEAEVVRLGAQGVRNVLIELGMSEGAPRRPQRQAVAHRTLWVRAAEGGLLYFHVSPGDQVDVGQPIATNTDLLGRHRSAIIARASGIILGMTTRPAVKPGDPICHIALPDEVRRGEGEEVKR